MVSPLHNTRQIMVLKRMCLPKEVMDIMEVRSHIIQYCVFTSNETATKSNTKSTTPPTNQV